MTSEQALYMIMGQNGEITVEQYEYMYHNSPTLQAIFFDEDGIYKHYKYEVCFWDKEESIYFNIVD